MPLYQCVTCEAFETITQFTPEACSSCGGTLSLATDPEDQPNEPAEVVHNDPATWLGAIWHVLEMAREDCISEDQNGPHDRAWEEVCTAMAWIGEELGVEQTRKKGVQS